MSTNRELLTFAKKLRLSGQSYSQINQKLGIPKSTLSYWFSRNKWSQQVTKKLQADWREEHTNRLVQLNKNRRLITLIKYDQYRKEATVSFPKLYKNPLFLIGLSLYWGEGEKTDKGIVGLINSDVNLLIIMANFYRKILKVPEEKLRVALFIYKDINKEKAINFWSRSLKIKKSQFIKIQTLPSKAKLTRKKVKHGICNLYFSNTELNIKIRHWIYLLSGKIGISS